MMRVFAIGVVIASLAASAAAHVSENGEPCHMGPHPMSSGTIAEQWHCHKPKPAVSKAELHRQRMCQSYKDILNRMIRTGIGDVRTQRWRTCKWCTPGGWSDPKACGGPLRY